MRLEYRHQLREPRDIANRASYGSSAAYASSSPRHLDSCTNLLPMYGALLLFLHTSFSLDPSMC
ncbi:MAG: hypothetical protein AVDCRST_MAG26-1195 [uncultured Chloroflexia bacterium]|uniref:Uncharacterized protein n=1 Tax=uncultured Chloroflexia bacterium TaxID=1672391 RepID=A0A6J4HWN6_9CHLR|nr:MAG: hypothetical protein AVDCRST_MAG26-1195 [uncultured Chloroflexia bacterium]